MKACSHVQKFIDTLEEMIEECGLGIEGTLQYTCAVCDSARNVRYDVEACNRENS